jgi:hypothetical protein
VRDLLGHARGKHDPFRGALFYVYRSVSPRKLPIPPLPLDSLLFPPIIVHKSCWTSGCLERVGNVPLLRTDVLKRHCFEMHLTKRLCDESGKRLRVRTEPCGDYSLTLPLGLAKRVVRAIDGTSTLI